MPLTTTGANDILALLLTAVALPIDYGNTLYISAHTSAPGANGNQSTNECTYTGYQRVAVSRSNTGWTVTGASGENDAQITFPEASGGSETITHIGIGTDASGPGRLIAWGALTPNISVSEGVTPNIPAGSLDVTLATS